MFPPVWARPFERDVGSLRCQRACPATHTWFVYTTTHADLCRASEMAADGGSSAPQLPCVFSPKCRQYLALCAQDGRLRVWKTDSKTLHQEYVPSAHLSATCICIAWGPCRTVKVRKDVLELPAILANSS